MRRNHRLCEQHGMAVSRTNRGGKALMAVSLDSPSPPELVASLHEAGMDDVYVIQLGADEQHVA